MGHRSGKDIMSVVWPYLWLGDMQGGPGGRDGHWHAPHLYPVAALPGSGSFHSSWYFSSASCGSGKGLAQMVSKGLPSSQKHRSVDGYVCYVVKHQGLAYWERPLSTIKSTKMKTQVPTHIPPSLNTFDKSRMSSISN